MRWLPLIAVILGGVSIGYFFMPANEMPLPEFEGEPLSCTLQAEPTCQLGTGLKVVVEITNRLPQSIYLVGHLDASDYKARYPHCYFEVSGPKGKVVRDGRRRCGNMNPLRQKDFIRVPSGGTFNPHPWVNDSGFSRPHQLDQQTFKDEGEYRICFVYSTEQADIKSWLGDGRSSASLERLLRQVPRTTIRSNEVAVNVVGQVK